MLALLLTVPLACATAGPDAAPPRTLPPVRNPPVYHIVLLRSPHNDLRLLLLLWVEGIVIGSLRYHVVSHSCIGFQYRIPVSTGSTGLVVPQDPVWLATNIKLDDRLPPQFCIPIYNLKISLGPITRPDILFP